MTRTTRRSPSANRLLRIAAFTSAVGALPACVQRGMTPELAAGGAAMPAPYPHVLHMSDVEGQAVVVTPRRADGTVDWPRSRVDTATHEFFGTAVLQAVQTWRPTRTRHRSVAGDSIIVAFDFAIARCVRPGVPERVPVARHMRLRWFGDTLVATPSLEGNSCAMFAPIPDDGASPPR